MTKWDSFQGCKGGTVFTNKLHNTSHKEKERQKPYDHINRCGKSTCQGMAHIYDKNTQQSVSRGSTHQHNKGHISET